MGRRSRSNAASARGTSSPASPNARSRAIASSNPRRVPDPIEKCTVRRASPIRTNFPENQRRFDSSGNWRHSDLFEARGGPSRSGANTRPQSPHAGVAAQVSQDLLERKAPDRGKPVAVDVLALVAMEDTLNRPAFHHRLQDVRELRLIALEKRERPVGEYDPESVGRSFGILLGDLDPPRGIAALGEQGKQQAGGSRPAFGDAHLMNSSYFTVAPPRAPA